jgi:hypothetical protein
MAESGSGHRELLGKWLQPVRKRKQPEMMELLLPYRCRVF